VLQSDTNVGIGTLSRAGHDVVVAAVTRDGFLDAGVRPAFIEMDIEAHEPNALAGMKVARCPSNDRHAMASVGVQIFSQNNPMQSSGPLAKGGVESRDNAQGNTRLF